MKLRNRFIVLIVLLSAFSILTLPTGEAQEQSDADREQDIEEQRDDSVDDSTAEENEQVEKDSPESDASEEDQQLEDQQSDDQQQEKAYEEERDNIEEDQEEETEAKQENNQEKEEVNTLRKQSTTSLPLQEGDRSAEVIALKENLNKLGFGNIKVTEFYGSFTTKKVREFQNYYGLQVTGKADATTLDKIDELLSSPLQQGKHSDALIPIKKKLNWTGYGKIKVTTYFGSFTEKKVKEFQKDQGLPVSGIIDEKTEQEIDKLFTNTFQRGARHDSIITLKENLNALGFGNIKVTTLYGSFTEQRVKEFQTYYGLKATGQADLETLDKMEELLSNPLQPGKRHEDTIQLKKDLNRLGFGNIKVTSLYGSFTEKRVKDFQRHYGLKVTGIADSRTLDKIDEILSSPFQKGKRHEDTIQLKKNLNELGFGGIKVTTYYGDFTEKRVKEFQRAYDLPVSGIADEVTLATIDELLQSREEVTYTSYGHTLEEALNIQMNQLQQTDMYRNSPAYVHSSYVQLNGSNQGKTTSRLNVRAEPNNTSHIYGTLNEGATVTILEKGKTWHKIQYNTWRNPTRSDVKYYLDPNNNDRFQHLVLTSSAGVPATELNRILQGKGVLEGLGQAFIDGGKQHAVNEVYLISHALLETGHGTSTLAKGVEVGKDKNGNLVLVNSSNRSNLTDIKTTYNMFGIGAVDSNPLRGGAFRAYNEGWYTPEAAIKGGAKFIADRYIHNKYQQNTLYKMRWNPANPGYPQYATDIAWAVKQVTQIKNMYSLLNNPMLHFNIPQYK